LRERQQGQWLWRGSRFLNGGGLLLAKFTAASFVFLTDKPQRSAEGNRRHSRCGAAARPNLPMDSRFRQGARPPWLKFTQILFKSFVEVFHAQTPHSLRYGRSFSRNLSSA